MRRSRGIWLQLPTPQRLQIRNRPKSRFELRLWTITVDLYAVRRADVFDDDNVVSPVVSNLYSCFACFFILSFDLAIAFTQPCPLSPLPPFFPGYWSRAQARCSHILPVTQPTRLERSDLKRSALGGSWLWRTTRGSLRNGMRRHWSLV